MPALDTCRSGVDDHHVILAVTHDFQYMRMAADEYMWVKPVNESSSPKVVMPRVSADVGHEDRHTAAFEEFVVRVVQTDILSVTIAVNSDKRFESSNGSRCGHASSEVSCMPNLVYRFEKFLELVAEYSVGVRYESNVRHFVIAVKNLYNSQFADRSENRRLRQL